MIFAIIILFSFGFAHGQVPWWDLPNFYLNTPSPVTSLKLALEHAAANYPEVLNFDY